jgi:hypothetical protein
MLEIPNAALYLILFLLVKLILPDSGAKIVWEIIIDDVIDGIGVRGFYVEEAKLWRCDCGANVIDLHGPKCVSYDRVSPTVSA